MFCVYMENLRSSFRTSCEQSFFLFFSLSYLSSRLDSPPFFGPRYYPDGPSSSTQCLYVIFKLLAVALPFHDVMIMLIAFSTVYYYRRTYSGLLYISLLSRQSLSTPRTS